MSHCLPKDIRVIVYLLDLSSWYEEKCFCFYWLINVSSSVEDGVSDCSHAFRADRDFRIREG